MARRNPTTVRSAALRRHALDVLKTISMGFKSGEYCGRRRSVARACSIAALAVAFLCAWRLSRMTMSPRLSVGFKHCST